MTDDDWEAIVALHNAFPLLVAQREADAARIAAIEAAAAAVVEYVESGINVSVDTYSPVVVILKAVLADGAALTPPAALNLGETK